MFAARYFAPTYFPPRYFPSVGAALPEDSTYGALITPIYFRDRLFSRLFAWWTFDAPIAWQGVSFDAIQADALQHGFIRPALLHDAGERAELARPLNRRFGRFVVQVFTPSLSGRAQGDLYVQSLREFVLQDLSTMPGGALFGVPEVDVIGPDGGYDQINVSAPFQYDTYANGAIPLN